MRWRSSRNPLERRLREVEQDSVELGAEIRRLQRALKNPERLFTRREYLPPPVRGPRPPPEEQPAPAAEPPPPAPAPAPAAPPPAPAAGELFAWNPAAGGAAPPAAGRKAAPEQQRFAQYFSSTGFLGKPALRQERNVLRNRAIFVAVIVIILGGILFKLIFR